MVFNKKGQGLSLNVIIVAALALIVLVVLIMVFTGRIGIFERGLSKEGQTELIKMKISYGDCSPNAEGEEVFISEFGFAESDLDKASAKTRFEQEISRCKSFTDQGICEAQTGCKW